MICFSFQTIMEASSTQPLPKEQQDLERAIEVEKETKITNTVEKDKAENIEASKYSPKEEEKSDSDSHSDDLSSNDDQNHIGSGSNSQFYESSDSKVDYAVKIDDNDTLSDIDDIKTDSASADSEDSALGSLPSDSAVPEREEEAQDRSEGSDSGIGPETLEDIKLSSFNLALPSTNSLKLSNDSDNNSASTSNNSDIDKNNEHFNTLEQKTPLKSNLKRKLTEEIVDAPLLKKKKHSIQFDNVTVYYFPRAQGFSCVPSQGGSTLGMEWEHSHMQKFSLAEHALEQRRLHRQILQQLKSERHSLQGVSLSSSEDSDTEEEASDISESELDLDSYYFLQPVPTRQRRALLRAAGVRKIEGYEKDECRDIRTSREFCGCACKGTCNPETCSCSLGGIKCQVDRLNFPCGCTRDGCSNTTGRIEFNPVRVRTHFIHTLMRVGLEKKNEENQEAVKRQWAQVHNVSTQPQLCISNPGYEIDHSRNQDDGLVREVSLTPRIEVESCVNAGNFNNVHCDMNNVPNQTSQRTYGYRSENTEVRNISENSMHYEPTSTHLNLADPYTSNILQGKGSPYSAVAAGTVGYEAMTNNMQRFPCDLNYTYDLHNDNNHFKGLHSFSASSFEEFAHSSHVSMFSHYGHNMYTPDYLHKPTTNMHDHSSLQYHNMHQNYYEMYKSPAECVNNEVKGEYATMTSPYQASNKLQTVENDENWFSHSTLLNLDQTEQATQDSADMQTQPTEVAIESNNTETTENFGELIKKTMVESVTV